MLRFLQWLARQERLLRLLRPLFGHFNPFLPEHRREPQTTWRGDRASKLRFRSMSEYGALCQVPSGACGGLDAATKELSR